MTRALDQQPLRIRRKIEVRAASEKEAIEIVLRNMRDAFTAEGYNILKLSVVEVEEV